MVDKPLDFKSISVLTPLNNGINTLKHFPINSGRWAKSPTFTVIGRDNSSFRDRFYDSNLFLLNLFFWFLLVVCDQRTFSSFLRTAVVGFSFSHKATPFLSFILLYHSFCDSQATGPQLHSVWLCFAHAERVMEVHSQEIIFYRFRVEECDYEAIREFLDPEGLVAQRHLATNFSTPCENLMCRRIGERAT